MSSTHSIPCDMVEMSGLVGYGSSDEEEEEVEEEEDDVGVQRAAKKPRPEEAQSLPAANEVTGAQTRIEPSGTQEPAAAPFAPPPQPDGDPIGPAAGPQAGPSAMALPGDEPSDQGESPTSPYTAERLRIRDLTMPPVPDFDIPDAPDPPPPNSEEAAVLAATTKKFERFLDLKKHGVHFNERLMNSASLRNPGLLPKLMEFAGISQEDSYRSTLGEEVGGVPVKWGDECDVEGLVKANERREKKRVAEREGVDFVPAAAKSGGSSARSTPGGTKRLR